MTGRVLITGGAGFIGSHVAELFAAKDWSVDILDDFSTGKWENVTDGLAVHEMDVSSREAGEFIARSSYDAVVHLAAQMDVRMSVADPLFDARTNILGTLNVLDALRRSGSKARLIFASTGGVLYGDHVTPPNAETTAKEPDSPYAIAKLAGEYYLAYHARLHGLDAVSLRFGNVYGPRQDPHGEAGVIAIFCGRILNDRPLTVYGDGRQTRDYVYVADVAQSVYLAARAPLAYPAGINQRAYNIGTGVGTSVLDLIASLERVCGRTLAVEFATERRGEQKESFVVIEKARSELGWSPRVSLDAGLAETFAWFQARAARASASAV
jgi:UDP-glucose 4-epimerase